MGHKLDRILNRLNAKFTWIGMASKKIGPDQGPQKKFLSI